MVYVFVFVLGFAQSQFVSKANCPSAHQHPSMIDNDLPKEVLLRLVFGPVAHIPLPNLQVSRFGAIPKKDRVCLSLPFGPSINDGINKEEFTSYSKVSDAIALIIKTGRSALMGKVDIKSAYASFQYMRPIDIN